MIRFRREVTITRYVKKCPYCDSPAKRVTCGKLTCQMKRHKAKMKEWWKEKGAVFNGLKRKD